MTAELSFASMFCLLLSKEKSFKVEKFSVRFQINRMSNCRFTALRHSNHISQSCYR